MADAADHRFARTHVLVIDDDMPNRELVKEYLSRSDLRVTAVPDGAGAQSELAAGMVDLVLLCLERQTGDCTALAMRLRQLSAIPVIILAGRAAPADRVMTLELGAADYLTQPFGARELLARMRAVLRRAMTARLERRQLHATRRGRPQGVPEMISS